MAVSSNFPKHEIKCSNLEGKNNQFSILHIKGGKRFFLERLGTEMLTDFNCNRTHPYLQELRMYIRTSKF